MNWDLLKPVLAGMLRHALTAAGGALVYDGVIKSGQVNDFIGAGMLIGGIAWSWWQKIGQAEIKAILAQKAAPAAGKVAVLFAIVAGSMALAPQVRAADVLPAPAPVKRQIIPAPTPCTLTSCSGFYVGFNVAGVSTNANVIGNGINGSLAAGGQSIGVTAGYQFWNGTWFFGPEVFGEYTVGGSPVVAGYDAPKYLFGEIVKLGGPLSTLFGGIAPANPTGLSTALTSQTISPYLFIGAGQRSWGNGLMSGAGVTFLIDPHWFADVRYINIQYTGSNQASPIQTVPQENIIWAGLNYKF